MHRKVFGRALRILGRGIRLEEFHHELLSLVGLTDLGALAVIKVRRERNEPLAREHVGDAFHLIRETPPLLDDDHPRPLARGRSRDIAIRGAAVRRELHHLTGHLRPPHNTIPQHPYSLDLDLDAVADLHELGRLPREADALLRPRDHDVTGFESAACRELADETRDLED